MIRAEYRRRRRLWRDALRDSIAAAQRGTRPAPHVPGQLQLATAGLSNRDLWAIIQPKVVPTRSGSQIRREYLSLRARFASVGIVL